MEFGTTREEMRGFTKLGPEDWAKKRDYRAVKSWKNLEDLAKCLCTNLENGVSDSDGLAKRREKFGENKFASMPMKSYLDFLIDGLGDPVLQILMAAVVVAFIVGMIEHPEEGWIEAVAISIAVVVVSNVTASSDYNKQSQFAELYKTAVADQGASVIRGGQELQLQKEAIVVGDIVVLRAGGKIPADGLLIYGTAAGDLSCDEADLTGEALPQSKNSEEDDYFHADTNVKTGTAKILIVAVGSDTITGRIKEDLLEAEDEETPLQKKLNVMVDYIGYYGLFVATCVFIALMIRQGIDAGSDGAGTKVLDGFIVAVTVVVVAVPEGLPLAVTIALAYSMGAMYKDHIFVKVLAACETMGGATCICSDKTGTLTQNIMTVAGFWCADKPLAGHEGAAITPDCPVPEMLVMLGEMISLNSDAAISRVVKSSEDKASDLEKGITTDTTVKRTGSATDCALLELHERLFSRQDTWADERKLKQNQIIATWPFSSVIKKAGVAIKHNAGVRLYIKGAGEKLMVQCSNYVDSTGASKPLSSSQFANPPADWMSKMQIQGFRVIAMCYRDFATTDALVAACGGTPGQELGQELAALDLPETELSLFGAAAIHDPLRLEVPEAVAGCHKAGVKVVMVTGDAKPTAMFIAKSCGIYNPPAGIYDGIGDDSNSGTAIEAGVYRRLYDAAMLAQYGSRKLKAVEIREEKNGDEVVRICMPGKGSGTGWRAVASDQNELVNPGNKRSADKYEGFPKGDFLKKGQLDLWAFGISNEYDDSAWSTEDQASIEELNRTATAVHLGSHLVHALWEYKQENKWERCDDWCSAELEELHVLDKKTGSIVVPTVSSGFSRSIFFVGPDMNVRRSESSTNEFLAPFEEAQMTVLRSELEKRSTKLSKEFQAAGKSSQAEVCEKLGDGILPPLDRKDEAYMALSDQQRSKKMRDGGFLAQAAWAKVDAILYGVPGAVGCKGLQVMARSLPDDKLKLVKRYMLKGEVVGVTGDGTNDAPALRHASVGLAMGSGTDVAKDAAEITITNDNFASIVRAIMWGRNIFDNIRKFLMFQLTVNCVALLLTFIMACSQNGKGKVKESLPLNAVMLLWVNLIMDSMGALALATELPSPALLERPPHGKERLLSFSMVRMIIGQSAFQLTVLLILSTNNSLAAYACNCVTDVSVISTEQKTTVFNAFVFCQFFNEINARSIKEFNVFSKFFDSPWFTMILIFTACLQTFMVEIGGSFVGTTGGLTWRSWLITIAIGAGSIPMGFLCRLIPVEYLEKKYGYISDEELAAEEEEEEEEEENHARERRRTLSVTLHKNDTCDKDEESYKLIHITAKADEQSRKAEQSAKVAPEPTEK